MAALLRLPFFAGVTAQAVEGMLAQVRWLVTGPGQTIIDFEDPTTDVYFIVQGAIRVLVRTADGEHTRILGDFSVGDLVGELSAIDGAPRSARVETLVRTRLCIIPSAVFLRMALGVPALGLRVMRLLSGRIRSQNQRLMEQAALPIRLRVAAELLRLSRPRPDGTGVISPPPIQEDLANRVGARRETVSRELAALTRAGLLRRGKGALVLSDPVALDNLVQGGFGHPAG